ncbi:hypothetical protein Cs7R123_42810 [Catellatospora sp. TT07R-123]|uniref:type VII secretion integral membrane protein EccD n=1 Tax=Catellatospora sp. TT07R-123 TaxID=2733863 RepID=UPI001B0E38A7|nr:type VII secretion integral membrane protein EccD [Catellatospora sp. TT07R-123]GHJ46939.1 hypothetical protein Cs7R123_42810 [Catellatospora sp. TT07R-123]
MSAPAAERCRITVVAPQRSLDLAVPANIPLVDVLPAIVDLLGADAAQEYAGRGVVLQRLGGGALDEDQTVTALGLRDGDLVYLSPRDTPMPTFPHDDLIDGVAGKVRESSGRWSPALTRGSLLASAAAGLAFSLGALLLPGPAAARTLTAGVLAAVLLAGAALAARALADRAVALLLALGGVGAAALGGSLLPELSGATTVPPGARLAAAVAATAVTGAAAAAAISGLGPALGLVAAVAGAAALGGLLQAGGLATTEGAAATVVVLMLLLSPAVPTLAFRLAGMRLPDLPTSVADITREVEPIPDDLLSRRSALADAYVTAGYTAIAVTAAVAAAVLHRGGWAALTLTGTVSVLLLLRSRVLTGAWQRLALLGAAAAGIALLVLRAALDGGAVTRTLVVPAAGLAATVLLLAALRAPAGRRPRPYWGRLAEIGETTLAVALIPLLLAVLDVYRRVRGLGG